MSIPRSLPAPPAPKPNDAPVVRVRARRLQLRILRTVDRALGRMIVHAYDRLCDLEDQ